MKRDIATIYRFEDGQTIIRGLTAAADRRMREQAVAIPLQVGTQAVQNLQPAPGSTATRARWFLRDAEGRLNTHLIAAIDDQEGVIGFAYQGRSEFDMRTALPFWSGFVFDEVLRTTTWQQKDDWRVHRWALPLFVIFVPDIVYETLAFTPKILAKFDEVWDLERVLSLFIERRQMDTERMKRIGLTAGDLRLMSHQKPRIIERALLELRQVVAGYRPRSPGLMSIIADGHLDIAFNVTAEGVPLFAISQGDPAKDPDFQHWKVWLDDDLYAFGKTPLEAMENAPFFAPFSTKEAWLKTQVKHGESMTIDLSSYYLLGLNPMLWSRVRFRSWWRGLEEEAE